MNSMEAAVLEPVGEGQIALQGVGVDATLRGLLSEVTVSQIYENLEETNIESVDSDKGNAISRHVGRLIHKAEKRLGVGEDLKDKIEALMEAMV